MNTQCTHTYTYTRVRACEHTHTHTGWLLHEQVTVAALSCNRLPQAAALILAIEKKFPGSMRMRRLKVCLCVLWVWVWVCEVVWVRVGCDCVCEGVLMCTSLQVCTHLLIPEKARSSGCVFR